MNKFLSLALAGVFTLAIQSVWADSSLANTTPSAAIMSPTPMATPVMKSKKKMRKKAMKTVWVCPMGDYTGDQPGKCPNCQMDLVKKEIPADAMATPAAGTKMN